MTTFKKHYIQNPETKAKCRVHYSLDNRCDGKKCVTIYAKSCLDSMNGILIFENDSDYQSDYVANDRAVIFEDNPMYQSARAVAEDVNFKKIKCSICNAVIIPNANGWDGGNNAEPINDGRCCDKCNDNIVIPARISRLGKNR